MRWPDIWKLITSWKGIIPSVIAVTAAIYYGPKKMLEVWDWYVDRFRDRPVLAILKHRQLSQQAPFLNFAMRGGISQPAPIEFPHFAEDIAKALNRSKKSVLKSLNRLHYLDKAEPYQMGWRLKP
jgi:hypothetical protein